MDNSDASAGLYYVRSWVRGREQPFETKHTELAKAEADFGELQNDPAYSRIEILVCREWITRHVTPRTPLR